MKTATKWEDENLSIQIDCPEHLTHKATLYTMGHPYAGIWECDVDGTSDSCPHFDVEVETVEADTMRNGEHDTYEQRIYACVLCGCKTDGDPDLDRAEEMDCD